MGWLVFAGQFDTELKLYKHLDKLCGISAVRAKRAKRVIRQKRLTALSDTQQLARRKKSVWSFLRTQAVSRKSGPFWLWNCLAVGATNSTALQEHKMRSESWIGFISISTVTYLHVVVHPLAIFGLSIIPSFNLCPPTSFVPPGRIIFASLISSYNGRFRVAAPSGHLTDHLTPVQPTKKVQK